MRRLTQGLLVMLALATAVSLALAQDDTRGTSSQYGSQSSTGQMQTISGTVVSSSDNSLTITMDSGQQMKFEIDKDHVMLPQNLRTGDRVEVTYNPLSGGKFQASHVMMASGTSGVSRSNQDQNWQSGSSQSGSSMSTTPQRISGRVVTSDDNTLTITTDSGQRMTFQIDRDRVMVPQNLQAGNRVDVSFNPGTAGDYSATNITIASSTTSPGSQYGTSGTGQLPGTASPLPLIGISGLLAVAGALGLRFARRR